MTLRAITETFRALCYGAAAIFFVYATLLMHEARAAAPAEIAALNSQLNTISSGVGTIETQTAGLVTDATRIVETTNGTLNTFRQIEAKERDTLDKQLELANGTATKLNAILDDAGATVKEVKEKIPAMSEKFKQLSGDAHVTLVASSRALNAAADDLSNPSIAQSLGDIAALISALRDAALHGNNVMVDVQKIADHYEIKIDSPATTGQKFVVVLKVASVIIGNLFKGVL